ncbi:unnamed protein product [Brugia timori]|uniref:Secreted protein n=1 Tax=Brugia timori TaxID=42155 RepID=A0A0R3QHQ0_9BILA|nr:unnamed protein product [Brugia timori]
MRMHWTVVSVVICHLLPIEDVSLDRKISILFRPKWRKMSSGGGQGAIPVPGPIVAQSLDAWPQNMSVVYVFDY